MIDPKIKTLLTLVSTGSFTAAAYELSLTQPAVSHHIRQLEELYNAPIFYRDRKSLRLTPEGEIILRYARRAAALHEKLFIELEDRRRSQSSLSIGITPSAQETPVPHILAAYTQSHPGTHISLITGSARCLHAMMRSFELDVAIVDGTLPENDMTSLRLVDDRLCLAAAPDSPLAKLKSVTLDDVRQQNLILRPRGTGTRDLFESHLHSKAENIRSFNITIELDSIALIKDLVAAGHGCTVISHTACAEDFKNGRLVAIDIEGMHMAREINLVYSPRFQQIDILHDIRRHFCMR